MCGQFLLSVAVVVVVVRVGVWRCGGVGGCGHFSRQVKCVGAASTGAGTFVQPQVFLSLFSFFFLFVHFFLHPVLSNSENMYSTLRKKNVKKHRMYFFSVTRAT